MIRTATHEDIPHIVELGAEFLAASPHAWVGLDRDAFADFAGRMIDHGVIFLSDDGMIGGVISPMFFNPAVSTVAELFWFARKEGRELRKALEVWAREKGAAGMTCAGLINEREATIRKVYERAGYVPSEVAFVKRFAA